MKFLDEYRDARAGRILLDAIARAATRPWTIMEVCGGQTHALVKHGIDRLLPSTIELIHGPGCPVCVTPLEMIDRAQAIAERPGVIFCSFGDMLRVPGSHGDLLKRKAQGADVRVVYSPLDAVAIAAAQPDRQVVFFAIGFETTAPATALTAKVARERRLANFSLLVAHVLVPPVVAAILQAPGNRVQGLLGPGHVCSIMGYREYEPIARRFRIPIVVAGFEPVDLLDAIHQLVGLLEAGEARVENQYRRAVRREGNIGARRLLDEVFEVTDRKWRGIGTIPKSGFRLSYAYRDLDAEHRFEVSGSVTRESPECISGQVLRGVKKPRDCPAFGTRCTPRTPLGATMVSSEGACAAYYAYARLDPPAQPGPGGV